MGLIRVRHVLRETPGASAPHAHAEGQLFIVRTGLVSVVTARGRWVLPPGHLGWAPPHAVHGAVVHDGVDASSLYFDAQWSGARMPANVKVAAASPLLTGLLEALSTPALLAPRASAAYGEVFADAFSRQPARTLFLPMPQDARLLTMATALLAQPDDATDLDGWGARIGMSRRSLTRRFQAETGWSVGRWRQQMRLQKALEMLANGRSVTSVALDLGYESVSAFIALFRKQLSLSPKAWATRDGRR